MPEDAETETINLALDGTEYQITLPRAETETLRRALTPYIKAARTTDRLDQLERFIATTGRLPTSKTPVEDALSKWVANVRAGRAKATPDVHARVVDLARTTPRAPRPPRGGFSDHRINDLNAFAAANRRLPRVDSDDPKERSLARWLKKAKAGKIQFRNDADAGKLLELLELFSYQPATRAADERAAEFVDFVTRAGRLPRQRGFIPGEQSLLVWYRNYRAGKLAISPSAALLVEEATVGHGRKPTR